jgi:hypothetical protein
LRNVGLQSMVLLSNIQGWSELRYISAIGL